jgi:hypothetical protein
MAYIEEVKEGEDNNGSDLAAHTHENNEVPDLATCTA